MKKHAELFKAAILFPGTVLVLVPATILYFSSPVSFLFGAGPFAAAAIGVMGVIFLSTGLYVALRTIVLFFTQGDGTPAPWAPPKHFVVSGPYAHVRNPMLLAVIFILLAEGLFFGSLAVMAWAGLFWAVSTLYFIHIEEPELERRFGASYLEYRKNVARWVPRLKPWRQPPP